MTTPVTDLAGQMYDGIESLVVYTIDKPRVHDLVSFYQPILSEEFFRVSSIRTQVNAIHSETPLKWFELQLEYAPVGFGKDLKIEKEYVYDLSTEMYLLKSDYEKYMIKLDSIKNALDQLFPFYSKKYDLLLVDDIHIPIEVNELVIFIKNEFMKKYKDIFSSIKKPYGYIDRFPMSYETIDSLPFKINPNYYNIYNMESKQVEIYLWSKNDSITNQIDEILFLANNIYNEYVKT
jgi:hypothetical protein